MTTRVLETIQLCVTYYSRDSLYSTLSITCMLIVPCQHPDNFECSAMRKRKENPLTEDKSGKKRVCLTLGQKRDVICRLAENKAVPEVATEFGISCRQVYDIWKHIWIRTSTSHEEDCIAQGRKKQRKPTNSLVDEAVYKWFVDQRSLGVPISGPILRAQALRISSLLNQRSIEDTNNSKHLEVGCLPSRRGMASIACMFKDKVCQQIVPMHHHMWTDCRFNLMKGRVCGAGLQC